jgi:hypothetical protein
VRRCNASHDQQCDVMRAVAGHGGHHRCASSPGLGGADSRAVLGPGEREEVRRSYVSGRRADSMGLNAIATCRARI